jgi:hypothetical protein
MCGTETIFTLDLLRVEARFALNTWGIRNFVVSTAVEAYYARNSGQNRKFQLESRLPPRQRFGGIL